MGSVKDYELAICPPWLLGPYGRAWHIALGLFKDGLGDAMREAVVQRFVEWCANTTLRFHGSERGLPRAPGEDVDAWRLRLLDAWNAWQYAGTATGILAQLVPAGVTAATVHEGETPDGPSTWGEWWLEVVDPHPFTAPIKIGDGHKIGDGWLIGFGNANAIEYVRHVVRKWQPAHVLCTGIEVTFTSPSSVVVVLPLRPAL